MSKTTAVIKALAEGTFWAGLGVFLLWLTLPIGYLSKQAMPPLVQPASFWTDLFSADFARRWDGGCMGWDEGLSILYLASALGLWWAYVNIAFVLLRLHPILSSVPGSALTVRLMVMFFIGCGGVHLLNAYAIFNPIYRAVGLFKLATALVSMAGSVGIVFTLSWAFAVVTAKRKRAEELELLLAQRKLK